MLDGIFADLDEWLSHANKEASLGGTPPFRACAFRIVGQTALLQASLSLSLAATADVDAYSDAEFVVTAKLNELLRVFGLQLDPTSDEIWMPGETRYIEFFKGDLVTAYRAEPVHVLVSKACKAPRKNRMLIREYIAGTPEDEFFHLCQKYGVDLDDVMKD
jgi:hypothetical protein